MSDTETTRRELKRHGITSITEGSALLLGTVTLTDNRQDTWLECIDDNGDKVRLVPVMTGWRDGRREVMVMNCRSGINTKLFFRNEGRTAAIIIPHDATMSDEQAKPVMWAIPFPCLEWAALRAK
ncbi:MAG: hypothetical protein VZR11_14270 [Succinimonas sp.]|nr:hypothetical protein [Succinimonas sp.]